VSTVLWVDASQGAAGDMLLGALLELGVELAEVEAALRRLPVDGWRIEAHRIVRTGLAATKLEVTVGSDGPGRGWSELERIAGDDSLPPRVRRRSLAIFRRLIEAEARVHGSSPEKIHLHEAGGIDAIVDVVGFCLGLEQLGVDEIVVSEMTTGFGEIECAHGRYPVPAPATAQLIRDAPARGGDIEAERLTPTGAAILTTLADRWGALPSMRTRAIGVGAGSRDLGAVPNVVRLFLGEGSSESSTEATGEVAVLECTVDDMTPQTLAHTMQGLLGAGALEAFTTPVLMKKGRAGHHLTVLTRPDEVQRFAHKLLRESSSLGVRFRLERRFELERSIEPVETEYGRVDVKVGRLEGVAVQAWPEYDDCATLAERHEVPLTRIQQAALSAYAKKKGDIPI
jgi:uncharacterized protein (TIGR00299 family) protein